MLHCTNLYDASLHNTKKRNAYNASQYKKERFEPIGTIQKGKRTLTIVFNIKEKYVC